VPPSDEGCGADLAWWFEKKNLNPAPGGVRKPLLMSALPDACKQVLLSN
jgi:penicillin-insensitive murein endopeptidase